MLCAASRWNAGVLALISIALVAGCDDGSVQAGSASERDPAQRSLWVRVTAPPTPVPPQASAVRARAEAPAAALHADPRTAALATARDALGDANPLVRLQAVQEIEPGPAATGLLLDALRDPDPRVRAAVVDGLAFQEPAAVRSGAVWALSDADPAVVLAAVLALEIVGNGDEVPALRALAVRGDPAVRARAEGAAAHLEAMGRENAEAGGGG